jgi:hypothetical protein
MKTTEDTLDLHAIYSLGALPLFFSYGVACMWNEHETNEDDLDPLVVIS